MLIKGYLHDRYDASGKREEQVFAVYPDGTIYQSGWSAWSPDFAKMANGHGRKWEKVEGMPNGVTYCGNYEQPI